VFPLNQHLPTNRRKKMAIFKNHSLKQFIRFYGTWFYRKSLLEMLSSRKIHKDVINDKVYEVQYTNISVL